MSPTDTILTALVDYYTAQALPLSVLRQDASTETTTPCVIFGTPQIEPGDHPKLPVVTLDCEFIYKPVDLPPADARALLDSTILQAHLAGALNAVHAALQAGGYAGLRRHALTERTPEIPSDHTRSIALSWDLHIALARADTSSPY